VNVVNIHITSNTFIRSEFMKKFTHAMMAITLVVILTLITVTGCKSPTSPDLDTVADVAFSYAEGAYNATLLAVELTTATPDATIYYSTDGSAPTTVYTGAIQVTAATTIKAVATKDGMDDSLETEASYTFNTPTVNEDFTNDTNWGGPPLGPWVLSGGRYRALSDGSNGLHLRTYTSGVSADFTVEMEISNVLTGENENYRGFDFRTSGAGNSYRFFFEPETGNWLLRKYVSGTPTTLLVESGDTPVNTGAATNVLRLVADGSTFDAYINGFHVGSATDTEFSTGGIALVARASTGTAGQDDVYYDNFLIW
jgi:hypothetical protein